MNPKKKSRRCRASVSIHALDLAISRFTNSLACPPLEINHSRTNNTYLHLVEMDLKLRKK
jgi:hypothetical protein